MPDDMLLQSCCKEPVVMMHLMSNVIEVGGGYLM